MTCRSLMAAALWMLASAADVPPAVDAADSIAWETDFDQALKKAKESNRPLMIAFILAGEPANEEVVRTHFKDPKILEASRHFVCLVACIGTHQPAGGGGGACPAFGAVTCENHVKVELRARVELLASNRVSCPQFLFLEPDGKSVLLRHVWMLAPSELLQKMRLARAFFDPSTAPELVSAHRDRISVLLAEADDNNAAKRHNALRTLALMDDPRITDFLLRQTGPQADVRKRVEAIFYMGQRGNAKVVPRLREILQTDDGQNRLYAAVALSQIAMDESTEVLLKVLKKESKDRVRSHILRALSSCCPDRELLRGVLIDVLAGSSQLDRVTALYLLTGVPSDPSLVTPLLKAAKATNTRVRSAAYYAIGVLEMKEGRDLLKSKLSSERDPAKSFCEWALAQLDGTPYEGELSPGSEIEEWMPDGKLYDGELE